MQLFYKQRGAVSVFLVIILVPIITVCSIFVDTSRVQLAKAQVSAAEDLALNTLMTNYDVDLNDYYGLLASAQSEEDFYDKVGAYFTLALSSSGVSSGDAAEYSSRIAGILSGDTDVMDFMQTTLAEGTTASVSALPNANLSNPAMMKKQIVEFMRYRAPINTAAELLQQLRNSSKELEDADKNTELVADRQAFYKAESQLMEDAYELYKLFAEYNRIKEYMDGMQVYLNYLEKNYKDCHEKMVRDLYNTQEHGVFVIPQSFNINETSAKWATAVDIETCVKNTKSSLKRFIECGKQLEKIYNSIPYNGCYEIQYWVQMEDKLNDSNTNLYTAFINAGKSLCSNKALLEKVCADVSDDDIKNLDNEVEEALLTYVGENSAYRTIAKRLGDISQKAIADGTTSTANTDANIKDVYQKLKEYCERAEDARKVLIQIHKYTKPGGTLEKDIQKYEDELDDWKKDAENAETSVAEQDRKDIAQLDQTIANIFNEKENKNISKLDGRIVAIENLMQSIQDNLKTAKYNGTPIIDIKNYNDFRKAAGKNEKIKEEPIPVKESELEDYVDASFNYTAPEAILKIDFASDLSLAGDTIYDWIMEKFANYDDGRASQGKTDHKNNEKEVGKGGKEAKEDRAKGNKNEIKEEPNLPSTKSMDEQKEVEDCIDNMSDELGKTSDFVSSLFGGISEKLNKLGTTVRDDLYTVEYVTDMFTYDTYEAEAAIKNLTDNQKTSLTYKAFNDKNNWSYQNEVEYIMYGGNNKQNKASSYGTIFLIRFALNLPADFGRYLNDGVVCSAANGIAVATCGIIPEGLARLAIVLGLTVAESVNDLNALSKGESVILIKEKEDLSVAFLGKAIVRGDGTTKKDSNKLSMYYSDYLKVLLFIKLMDSQKADEIYRRIGDVVQVNMCHRENGNAGFQLSKAVVYFKMTCDLQVSPMMLELGINQDAAGNPYQELGWRSFKYTTIRGY